jgi:hypothetical protein
MSELISMHIVGIKCDHCTWRNDHVKFEDYEQWLNKPCPVCGHNLLTEADHNTAKRMFAIIGFINRYFGWVTYFSSREQYLTSLSMNGTGKVKAGTPVKIKSK